MFLQNLIYLFQAASLLTRNTAKETTLEDARNIIFIMLDDLGRADIGSMGAEWETPNLDKFLSESVILDNHYIGYVCSASRSQFLTGRYSYHSGYGTLDVFDLEKIGHVPLQTPFLTEYLKHYTSYRTYGVGKWQLGSPTYNNMAINRGFDKFWGMLRRAIIVYAFFFCGVVVFSFVVFVVLFEILFLYFYYFLILLLWLFIISIKIAVSTNVDHNTSH